MLLLDTDHLSALEWRHTSVGRRLETRLEAQSDSIVTTIVNYEEQMRGWLALLARSRTVAKQIEVYGRLLRLVENYRDAIVLPFNEGAAVEYQRLRKSYRRIGTMDLKIAAIALCNGAKLLSGNRADFEQIAGLDVEDWIS